jgi:Family of unknown function (DUF6345)
MPNGLVVGAAWCAFFTRPGVLSPLWYRGLKHAYRGPTLFIARMRDAGYPVEFLSCDEELTLNDFNGATRRLQESADIFYLTTHGVYAAGYSALLHKNDWRPNASDIGRAKPVVAVFDTCFLIDSTTTWEPHWAVNLGPSLRLLLGFDNLAAIDRGSALRGRAFAENLLAGDTFADAWLKAVRSTTVRYNKAIAIAIGDDVADARSVLSSAKLTHMPGPRTSAIPAFALR